MNNSYDEPKIRFYGLKEQKIDLKKIIANSDIDNEKPIKMAKGLSKAIHDLTKKDILFLKNKLKRVITEINKRLKQNDIVIDGISSDIEDIENIIKSLDDIRKNVIKKKNSIKVTIFSSNKKEKKRKIYDLDNLINYLFKCKNDIISIKNEYNTLNKRIFGMDNIDFNEDSNLVQKEDPIERTINFYMNNKREN